MIWKVGVQAVFLNQEPQSAGFSALLLLPYGRPYSRSRGAPAAAALGAATSVAIASLEQLDELLGEIFASKRLQLLPSADMTYLRRMIVYSVLYHVCG